MLEVPFRIVIGIVIGLAVQVSVAGADTGGTSVIRTHDAGSSQQAERTLHTLVIQLEHLDVDHAVGLVQNLFAPQVDGVAGVGRTNSLVLSGEEKAVQEIAEFIDTVDVPKATTPNVQTAFIPLQTYPTEHVMPLMYTLVANGQTRVAADEVNHQLVIQGTPPAIASARALVASIDQPAQSLRMEFSFIRGELGAEYNGEDAKLPRAMMPIAKTLAENGLGELTLMAPITVRAEAGSKFHSKSARHVGDEHLEFRVGGVAKVHRDGQNAQLELRAEMEGLTMHKKDFTPKPWFEIDTTVKAKLGSYTILAASPSTTLEGTAVALVVRVLRD